MNISFDGIGQVVLTFMSDGTAVAGMPVKMDDSMVVRNCATEGDSLIGIAANVAEDGAVAVIFHGYVRVPYSGLPAFGNTHVVSNGAGGIKLSTSGKPATVVDIDYDNTTLGMFI